MSSSVERAKSSSIAKRAGLGPKLIGVGIAGLVLSWVIEWLPLGLMGRWIIGILAPVIFLSFVAGAVLMWVKYKSKD